MKRILIIGCSGAGKSTFAKRLQNRLGIEVIHLDQHYWRPGWERTDKEEWKRKVGELIQEKQWIMDGNYRSTFDLRAPLADTIIWLDFHPLVCLFRACKRRFKQDRADELDGCKERMTFELFAWILWKFPTENKKDLKRRTSSMKSEKNVHILKSNKDVEAFLSGLG